MTTSNTLLAHEAAERFLEVCDEAEVFIPYTSDYIARQIISCNRVIPMNLARMVDGRRQDLVHDVAGILVNWNDETGNMKDCFLPRYSILETIRNGAK